MADYNKPFIAPAHAEQPLLSTSDMTWMKASDLVQILCGIICLSSVLCLGSYYLWITSQPYWKADASQLDSTVAKIREKELARDACVRMTTRLNQRIRFDLLALPLLMPDGNSVRIESIDFKTIPKGSLAGGRFSVTASTSVPDPEAAKTWLRRLGFRLKQAFPTREVELTYMDCSMDQRTGNLRFLFTGEIQ